MTVILHWCGTLLMWVAAWGFEDAMHTYTHIPFSIFDYYTWMGIGAMTCTIIGWELGPRQLCKLI